MSTCTNAMSVDQFRQMRRPGWVHALLLAVLGASAWAGDATVPASVTGPLTVTGATVTLPGTVVANTGDLRIEHTVKTVLQPGTVIRQGGKLRITTQAPPTITPMAAQTIDEDTSTAPLAFTIGDAETPVAHLALAVTSSNPALVDTANMTLGGTGGARSLTIAPKANQYGTTSITLTVTDAGLVPQSASTTFVLTVNPVNDVPQLLSIADIGVQGSMDIEGVMLKARSLVVNPDGNTFLFQITGISTGEVRRVTTGPPVMPSPYVNVVVPSPGYELPYTVEDQYPESANFYVNSLMWSPASGATGTVSAMTVRLVQYTMVPQSKGAPLRVLGATSAPVLLRAVLNNRPTISAIGNATCFQNSQTPAMPFTISDVETPVGSLVVSGAVTSADPPDLIDAAGIIFGGSGSARTLTLQPKPGKSGTAWVQVTVADPTFLSATTTVVLTVNPTGQPPVMTTLGTLSGATEDTPFILSYSAVLAASNATDPDTPTVMFRVAGIYEGLLESRAAGSQAPWVPADPILSPTTEYRWTPGANSSGLVQALSLTAWDGNQVSAPALPLSIQVAPVNDPPSTMAPSPVTVVEGGVSRLASMLLLDPDAGDTLTLTVVSSSNPTLVPVSGIVVGPPWAANGRSRVLTVAPAPTGTGTANVTLRVSDGTLSADVVWAITVVAASAQADASDADVTILYDYNPGGALKTMTARNRQGTALVDQTTIYLYESPFAKSLATSVIYPDSSDTTSAGSDQVKTAYDRLGRSTTVTDQRGVVRTFQFDNAGRVKADTATSYPAAVTSAFDTSIVPIPTAITKIYDNLGRPRKVTTTGTASTGAGALLNSITWNYDAWGQVTSAVQDHGELSQTITYQYANALNGTELRYRRLDRVLYPDGSAGPVFRYDDTNAISAALSRVFRISTATVAGDGKPIDILGEYTYLGATTVVKRETSVRSYVAGSSAYSSLAWDVRSGGTYTGLDRFGRLARRDWLLDGATVDGQSQLYDRANNPIHRRQTWAAPWQADESFGYDRLDRLIRAERGTNMAPGDAGRTATWGQRWDLDGLGNWSLFNQSDTVDATANLIQTRSHNRANEIDDDQSHATLTSTAIYGYGNDWIQPQHDAAGNVTQAPRCGSPTTRQHYTFDAWNRLCVVRSDNAGSPGPILAAYVYDGLNRRVEERAKNADYPTGRTWDVWFSESWQELTRSIRRSSSYAWRPGTAMDTGKPEEFYWDAYDPDVLLGMTVARDSAGVPLAGNLGGSVVAGEVRIVGLRYAYDTSSNVTSVVGVAYNDAANPPPMVMRTIERSRYTPYGERKIYRAGNWKNWNQVPGALAVVSASIARHGFGVGVNDQVVGLVHLRHRWYDAGLGRFVGRDPIGYAAGTSLVRYVNNSPINKVDPLGLIDPPDASAVLAALLKSSTLMEILRNMSPDPKANMVGERRELIMAIQRQANRNADVNAFVNQPLRKASDLLVPDKVGKVVPLPPGLKDWLKGAKDELMDKAISDRIARSSGVVVWGEVNVYCEPAGTSQDGKLYYFDAFFYRKDDEGSPFVKAEMETGPLMEKKSRLSWLSHPGYEFNGKYYPFQVFEGVADPEPVPNWIQGEFAGDQKKKSEKVVKSER